MSPKPKVSRLAFHAFLLGVAVLLVGAPTAQAGVLDNPVGCDTYLLERPFLRWENPVAFDYARVPDGGFEHRARDWQLTNGARVVRGNESYYVNRRTDSLSLYLPAGSEAISPAMCAGVEYPTLRLFTRNKGGSTPTLKVEMAYELAGNVVWVELLPLLGPPETGQPFVGTALTADKRWGPTLPMVLLTALSVPLGTTEGTSVIAFRFSPQGNADWWIDDAYVDPYRHY